MQQTFGHPSAGPVRLVESKRQETHSERLFEVRLKPSLRGLGFIRSKFTWWSSESDWRKKRREGGNDRSSKYSTGSLDQSPGTTLRSTRVDYVLCGNGFYSIVYWIEQVEVLPCPTRSMGAANAGTHAEPLYIRIFTAGVFNSDIWYQLFSFFDSVGVG